MPSPPPIPPELQRPENDGRSLGELIDSLIDSPQDVSILRELEAVFQKNPSWIDDYIHQMAMHSMLIWRQGNLSNLWEDVPPKAEIAELPRPTERFALTRLRPILAAALVLAAMLLIVVGVFSSRSIPRNSPVPVTVATILNTSDDIAWNMSSLHTDSEIGAGLLEIDSGIARLRFHSGAIVTCKGPARLVVQSPNVVGLKLGNITVEASEAIKGFTVLTPDFDVVDLGTEFGIERDAEGNTDVIVLDGLVELRDLGLFDTKQLRWRLLKESEAIRITQEKRFERIVQVQRDPKYGICTTGVPTDVPADTMILSVKDNLRLADSANFYQIVPKGLVEDVRGYVDRVHQWNGCDEQGIPEFLREADYIQTFNYDKLQSDLKIEVGLNGPGLLFVLWDPQCEPMPWLRNHFTKTDWWIGMDEGPFSGEYHGKKTALTDVALSSGPGQSIDKRFQVWAMCIEASRSVTLGSLGNPKLSYRKGMYGIAAKRFVCPQTALEHILAPRTKSLSYGEKGSDR